MDISYLVGDAIPQARPRIPFDDLSCQFLMQLGENLKSEPAAKNYPDVMTFAFWCRKGNITKLKERFADGRTHLGRGVAFHIAPSNVPIQFAFSYAFGLLSGNTNIVRVPSLDFPQTEIVCAAIRKVLAQDSFQELGNSTAFVTYAADDETTAHLSSFADARLTWGGDETVKAIRKHPIADRGIEIEFGDRYSLCIMSANAIEAASQADIEKLAKAFFNDTYLVDQNACSSPHLIVWLGNDCTQAKSKFWGAVHAAAQAEYEMAQVSAVEKLTKLCLDAVTLERSAASRCYGSFLYVVSLTELPSSLETLRGSCGYFYDFETDDLNTIAHRVSPKFQTVTYFGIDKSELVNLVVENRLPGIDRIVPVGRALDIDVIWDGRDLLKSLSRIVDAR